MTCFNNKRPKIGKLDALKKNLTGDRMLTWTSADGGKSWHFVWETFPLNDGMMSHCSVDYCFSFGCELHWPVLAPISPNKMTGVNAAVEIWLKCKPRTAEWDCNVGSLTHWMRERRRDWTEGDCGQHLNHVKRFFNGSGCPGVVKHSENTVRFCCVCTKYATYLGPREWPKEIEEEKEKQGG